MKQAVVAVICDSNGRILSVSRRNRPSEKGLPGGKVDDNETLTQAVIREIKEETGLNIIKCNPIFVDFDGEYETIAFQCVWEGEINPGSGETGVVEWLEWSKLLEYSVFKDYNQKLYKHLHQ